MKRSELEAAGGPAFPAPNGVDLDGNVTEYHGMTLRDYFAAKAMVAIFDKMPLNSKIYEGVSGKHFALAVAEQAYVMADAMLAERVKP